MSFTGPTSAAVQISGSVTTAAAINIPSTLQTLKTVSIQGSGAAKTVFTTTAGKTAYVYGYAVYGSSGAINANITLANDTTVVSSFYTPAAGSMSVVNGGGCPMFSIADGTNCRVSSGLPATATLTLWYVEV